MFYRQQAAARYFRDGANGCVYEVTGDGVSLLVRRAGERVRERIAELPPGLDELWCSGEQAWGLVPQES